MKSFPLSGLAYLFAFLITIATLMTLLRVDNFWLDLFQHFKFQYLIGSLALGSVGLYFKHRQLSIIMLICCLVNLTFIVPLVLPSSTTISALEAKKTLKVFHANLKTNNNRYELVIAEIRIQKPDIILLQEVDVVWKNQLKLLKNSYPFSKIESRPDNFGIAIYSKLPLNQAKVKYWGKANVPSLLVNFQWENEIVTLAYSHPLPPISQAYYALRNEQLKLMTSELSMIEAPLIVAGDFNISMWSYAYQYFEPLQLTNSREHNGILATWPAAFSILGIPIDHLLASNHFTIEASETGGFIGSDHLPLVTTLKLN